MAGTASSQMRRSTSSIHRAYLRRTPRCSTVYTAASPPGCDRGTSTQNCSAQHVRKHDKRAVSLERWDEQSRTRKLRDVQKRDQQRTFDRSTLYFLAVSSRPSLRMVRSVLVATLTFT